MGRGIQQAIEKAANSRRDEIDWVLSDSRKAVSQTCRRKR
jgi:type VI secretion system protein ImpL